VPSPPCADDGRGRQGRAREGPRPRRAGGAAYAGRPRETSIGGPTGATGDWARYPPLPIATLAAAAVAGPARRGALGRRAAAAAAAAAAGGARSSLVGAQGGDSDGAGQGEPEEAVHLVAQPPVLVHRHGPAGRRGPGPAQWAEAARVSGADAACRSGPAEPVRRSLKNREPEKC
jgi:hypothetical protein